MFDVRCSDRRRRSIISVTSLHFTLPPESPTTRLDHFLSAQLPTHSRARIQTLIRDGHVCINAAPVTRPAEKLRAGDMVFFTEPDAVPIDTQPEDIALDVLFEDPDLIVLNKPAGIVVHPAAGNWDGTLVNALLHHCGTLSAIGGEQRPGIVHRLDKETSGCLVAAKNDLAHQSLSAQFAGREIVKIYLALASGHFEKKSGVIEAAIGRHPVDRKKMTVLEKGRAARTDYRVLREIGTDSLVECTLHTGRTHQIRVHLKHLSHPLLGDAVYGRRGHFERQMLHAWQLGFTHPRSGDRLKFQAPIPADFIAAGVSSSELKVES